ncbi:potassium channel subfamily k [Lynx pardinus]|uniref:Potassium channel subfamily k n=1 Tax=Lynx pardinus TaxID=191816 RepID=A0A485N180_LYNPA|nr:potassium channel subfamily k [Lynx pardinus]
MSSRSPRPPPRRCRRRLPRPSCCCCCCRRSHLNEDTGRFVLLAALIGLYLVAGATVFSALESPGEAEARARWGATLRNFSAAHGVAEPELRAFLRHYEAALAAGVRADALRPRWDFPGAFYFVGTVVSTIVWHDHPRDGRREGLPHRLRAVRLRRNHPVLQPLPGAHHLSAGLHHARLQGAPVAPQRPAARHLPPRLGALGGRLPGGLEALGVPRAADPGPVRRAAVVLRLGHVHQRGGLGLRGLALLLLRHLQHHRLRGLGEQPARRLPEPGALPPGQLPLHPARRVLHLLALQRHLHPHQAGAQLDAAQAELPCRCCARCCPAPGAPLARRNAITPGSRLRRRLAALGADPAARDSDAEGRRLSGELISMRDLTASNKVSLALLQKQLSETANGYPRSVCVNTRQNGFSGGVGALGIMNNRLAETSASR